MKKLFTLMVVLLMFVFSNIAIANNNLSGDVTTEVANNFVWRGMEFSNEDITFIPQLNLNVHPFSKNNTVYMSTVGTYGKMDDTNTELYFKTFELGFERIIYKGLYARVGYYNAEIDVNTLFGDSIYEMYVQVGYNYNYKIFEFSPFYKFSKDTDNDNYNYHEVGAVLGMYKKIYASYTASYVEDIVTNNDDWFGGKVKIWVQLPLTNTVFVQPSVSYTYGLSDTSKDFFSEFNSDGDGVFSYGAVVGINFN